jgi:hypothetical protein
MMLTAHQPAYLPWLGYFQKMMLSNEFIILDAVQFEKNSFINRNKIKTSNGSAWMTVPILTKGYKEKTISDMRINNTVKWRKKHWLTLLNNYKKAPFFPQYCDFFEDMYSKKWDTLVDLVTYSNQFFIKELDIKTNFIKLSDLGIESKKQDLIIDLCKERRYNSFLFGSQGKEYVEKDKFDNEKIETYFQSYKHPIYRQQWGEFIPYLSIVDLLFNEGSEKSIQLIRGEK